MAARSTIRMEREKIRPYRESIALLMTLPKEEKQLNEAVGQMYLLNQIAGKGTANLKKKMLIIKKTVWCS